MDLKDLKQIASMMSEHDLTEFELEEEGRKLVIRRSRAPIVSAAPAAAPIVLSAGAPLASMAPVQSAPAAFSGSAESPPAKAANVKHITSEMPGTFYRAANPNSKPFVEVGDKITPASVVCIIEAMKVMNQITADCAGEIVDVLVENGEAVEYGQALFAVRVG